MGDAEETCEIYRRNDKYFALIGEEVLPVTTLIGSDGEEVEDYEDAVVVVAGPDKNSQWVTIELSGPAERMN